jgi:hypothetical protein
MTTSAPYLRFSHDAQEIFEKWIKDLQSRIEDEDIHPVIVSHLAKYRSLMPSLALIFHLVDYADGTAEGQVSKTATLQACAWCQYLESHARRLYALALDSGQMAAAALSKKIEAGKLESPFKVRTVQRKGWGQLTDSAVINDAVSILEDAGWIRASAPTNVKGPGRPQDPQYEISPKVMGK